MQDWIVKKIKQSHNQTMTYEEYMTAVLYDPIHGYYMKHKQKLGKTGDFYTSSNIHPIFSTIFVSVLTEVITKENLPFHICEFGAGNGDFAHAFMQEITRQGLESKVTYSIIETSPYHQLVQQKRLQAFTNVTVYGSLTEMQQVHPSFSGIVYSNELIDAFPVHVVQKRNNMIHEILVGLNEDNQLIEIKRPCQNPALLLWLEEYGPPLSNGQRIEIPLAMNQWIDDVSDWVIKGAVFTIDYGYTKEEWQQPERRAGSLRGYYQHQLINDPLRYPADMDLTTHIHLDAFVKKGKESGLQLQFMTTQDSFLIAANIFGFLQDNHDPDPFSEKSKQNRAIRSLIAPDGISRSFHIIVQTKNCKEISYSFTPEYK